MMDIISKYKIKAKKSLWQNFLQDESILDNISSFYTTSGENIIEVGPGYWALTEKLLHSKPKSLHLVELDTDMINILEDRTGINWDLDISDLDFKINNIDVLKYQPDFTDYMVIANIPYYITSPILSHFLYKLPNKPSKMVILMQKEVGEKILKKSKGKSSVISLMMEKKSDVHSVCLAPANCFEPAPKVDSIVLAFDLNEKFSEVNDDQFLDFIKLAFKEPRKKMIKNLSSEYDKSVLVSIFEEFNLSENTRAEELSLEQFVKLIKELAI